MASSAEQQEQWDSALAEHEARWKKGESLAPAVKHDPPEDLEDANKKCLQRHNQLRARHNAPPLEWSDDLAKSAYVVCKQSNDRYYSKVANVEVETLIENGQNAYMAPSEDDSPRQKNFSLSDAIDLWYSEVDNYNFEWLVKVQKCLLSEYPSEDDEPDWDWAGHTGSVNQFTQVISKTAKYVGMAKVGMYIVAKYDPPDSGPSDEYKNVSAITAEGKAEALAEGVQPPSRPKRAASKSVLNPTSPVYEHRHSMSYEEKRVKDIFTKADTNGDGVLSCDELEGIMERLGMSRKDTKRLILAADRDKDGVLSMDEFLTWVFSSEKTAKDGMFNGMLTSDGADGTAIAALPSPPAENVDPVIGAASTDAEAFGQSQATEALVQAVEDENWDEAEKLLSSSQGIDPNARTTDWDYAVLRAAAEGGAEETCRLLLDCKADVNGCDKNNMTAIMGCIVGGDNGHIVSLLLDRKADATMKTDDGFTALAWATRLKRDQSIQILRDAGMTGAATAFS